jgi:signal peptidase II
MGRLISIGPMIRRNGIGFYIFLLAVTADRVTKYLALGGVFGEPYLNRGVSFSLLDKNASAGLAVALAGVFLLSRACIKSAKIRAAPGLPLLWAGAVSNIADRLIYGFVIDWIHVVLFINLADIWLCLGGILLIRYWFSVSPEVLDERDKISENQEK